MTENGIGKVGYFAIAIEVRPQLFELLKETLEVAFTFNVPLISTPGRPVELDFLSRRYVQLLEYLRLRFLDSCKDAIGFLQVVKISGEYGLEPIVGVNIFASPRRFRAGTQW